MGSSPALRSIAGSWTFPSRHGGQGEGLLIGRRVSDRLQKQSHAYLPQPRTWCGSSLSSSRGWQPQPFRAIPGYAGHLSQPLTGLPKVGEQLGFLQSGAVGLGKPPARAGSFHSGPGRENQEQMEWLPSSPDCSLPSVLSLPSHLALPGLGNQKPILSSHVPRAASSGVRTRLLCPWEPRAVAQAGGSWAGAAGSASRAQQPHVSFRGNAKGSPFGFLTFPLVFGLFQNVRVFPSLPSFFPPPLAISPLSSSL